MTELVKYEMTTSGRVLVDGKPAIGHPVKLTDDKIDEIVTLVHAGNYLSVAFAAAGLSAASLHNWRDMADKVGVMYPDLHPDDLPDNLIPANVTPAEWQAFKLITRMVHAEAKAEAQAVLAIRKHFPDQWTAAMTYLERRFPERWRKRQTIEAIDGGSVMREDEAALILDPEALELLHDALERVAVAPSPEPSALPSRADDIDGRTVEA